MDSNELIDALQPFMQQCEQQGYGLSDIVLEEAYPGCQPTSHIVKVVAEDWMSGMVFSDALHQLLLILWQTTAEKIRENIFVLSIYRKEERHLLQQPPLKQIA
jgi:hypothetical protein